MKSLPGTNPFLQRQYQRSWSDTSLGLNLGLASSLNLGQWIRQQWQKFRQTPLWSLTWSPQHETLSLIHRERGLIRVWRNEHARLLLAQPSLRPWLSTRRQRAMQQHQVAHLLMLAAAIELMLRRLSKTHLST